jgi:hypothetical protein
MVKLIVSPRLLIALLLIGAAAGCASVGAQRAFDQGDYLTAAELADQTLRANPADAEMLSLRQRARDRFVDEELTRVRAFRAGGHHEAELAEWERLLKQVDGWGGHGALSPEWQSALAAESSTSGEAMVRLVDVDLGVGRPLAAEALLDQFKPLLAHAEFGPARATAGGKVRGKGQEVCARLQTTATAETPSWGLIVTRYCGHFGSVGATPAPEAAAPPMELAGTVKGMSAEQVARLRARVAEWVEASLWNDPAAGETGRGKIGGTIGGVVESSYRRATVTLHAPYEDTIKTSVVGTVGRQQAFGYASTKVTREYAYEAEEVRGNFGMNVSVHLELPTQSSVTLKLKRAEGVKGYDHDVSFEPAGIFPRHDRILTVEEWVDAQLDSFATRVTWALNRKFLKTYCARPQYTVEEAAHCFMVGQKPPAAMAVLTGALGDQAESALEILRPPPPAPEARKTAPTKPAPRTQAGPTDDEDPIVQ